jgi:hypothetical protein
MDSEGKAVSPPRESQRIGDISAWMTAIEVSDIAEGGSVSPCPTMGRLLFLPCASFISLIYSLSCLEFVFYAFIFPLMFLTLINTFGGFIKIERCVSG